MPRLIGGLEFLWGTAVPSVVTPTPPPPSTDPWAKLVLFPQAWAQSQVTALFPRFERMFPSIQPPAPVFASLITLTYRISTQFPFIIASKTNVLISSNLTVT